MDKRAERIAQDIKAIVHTRVAIAEKLEAIEQHVGTTMQHARTMMTQLADKTTTSVRETMQVTKDVLDPTVHAARHPWVFVGGALALGYAVGTIYRHGWKFSSGVVPYYPPGAKGAPTMPPKGSPSSPAGKPGVYQFYPEHGTEKSDGPRGQTNRPTIWAELEDAVRVELDFARSGLIGIVRNVVRELVHRTVPVIVKKIDREGRT
jgi:ElaB/YqjD/DUF883 family membrane-anchored ribosome-binding protein